MDDIDLEFKECGCKKRKKKSLDKTEWASAVRETKARLQGL
jgi:hypothetical protein